MHTISSTSDVILQRGDAEIPMSSLYLMLNIEKRHLDEIVRSSAEQPGALLCDESREFEKSGRIFDKAQILIPSVAQNFESRSL